MNGHWIVDTETWELPCPIPMTRESTEDERFLRSACRRRGSQQVEACRFGVAEYNWRFAKQMMLLRKDNFFTSLPPRSITAEQAIYDSGTWWNTVLHPGSGVNHEPMRQESLRLAVSL